MTENVFWFGWLTKPYLQVTMLDRVICAGELVCVFLLVLAFGIMFERFTK